MFYSRMKDTMLDMRNWTNNVYIREFIENSRGLANLSATCCWQQFTQYIECDDTEQRTG